MSRSFIHSCKKLSGNLKNAKKRLNKKIRKIEDIYLGGKSYFKRFYHGFIWEYRFMIKEALKNELNKIWQLKGK